MRIYLTCLFGSLLAAPPLHSAAQPTDAGNSVRRIYVEGMPYEVAKAYSPAETPALLEMLQDEEEAPYWERGRALAYPARRPGQRQPDDLRGRREPVRHDGRGEHGVHVRPRPLDSRPCGACALARATPFPTRGQSKVAPGVCAAERRRLLQGGGASRAGAAGARAAFVECASSCPPKPAAPRTGAAVAPSNRRPTSPRWPGRRPLAIAGVVPALELGHVAVKVLGTHPVGIGGPARSLRGRIGCGCEDQYVDRCAREQHEERDDQHGVE